jgi:hypothetical protein
MLRKDKCRKKSCIHETKSFHAGSTSVWVHCPLFRVEASWRTHRLVDQWKQNLVVGGKNCTYRSRKFTFRAKVPEKSTFGALYATSWKILISTTLIFHNILCYVVNHLCSAPISLLRFLHYEYDSRNVRTSSRLTSLEENVDVMVSGRGDEEWWENVRLRHALAAEFASRLDRRDGDSWRGLGKRWEPGIKVSTYPAKPRDPGKSPGNNI